MPKKLPKSKKKGSSLKTSIDPKPILTQKESTDAIMPENHLSGLFDKLTSALDTLRAEVQEKNALDFLEKIPGKLKKTKTGQAKKKKKSKKKPRERPVKEKRERPPKKRKAPTQPPKQPRSHPKFISSRIAETLGISNSFEHRSGLDPRFSVKDQRYEEFGKGGGEFVKQTPRRFQYESWKDAVSQQTGDWHHIIWLDPSAPSAIIHPGPLFCPKEVKIVKGRCPSKVDLGKEFGSEVEFIYMSPPWKSPNFGFGKRGYFTPDILDKIDFRDVQKKGFIFMWLPFLLFKRIKDIMDEKGYTLVDSCGAMLATFDGAISTAQRNPNADKNSSKHEDIVGRMAGTCVKGVLFKKTKNISKERYRIGNQIIYDAFQWRRKKDQFTGQLQPDHGYAYEMYQYLVAQKPDKQDVIHALHLFCQPDLKVKNFGGVEYFPDYNYEAQCLQSEV